MASHKPVIIFMGTPQFAVPSLEILIEKGYPVRAVVTALDKPSGRGLKIRESAVKLAALANNIQILQPSNLKEDRLAERLRDFAADLFVVVAFRMLPEQIWTIPQLGTVNLHASLLPLYRGAAPINHAIINGEKISGVTTFLIEKEIDTGKILFQEKTEIGNNETAGDLHDRLMVYGARLLLKTIEAMTAGIVTPKPQGEIACRENLPAAPKITKIDCRINWSQPADRLYDFVRGLSPYPGAWTSLDDRSKTLTVKIFEVEIIDDAHTFTPGRLIVLNNQLIIATGKGSVLVKRLQPEGRRPMTGPEFIRGFRPGIGASCI